MLVEKKNIIASYKTMPATAPKTTDYLRLNGTDITGRNQTTDDVLSKVSLTNGQVNVSADGTNSALLVSASTISFFGGIASLNTSGSTGDATLNVANLQTSVVTVNNVMNSITTSESLKITGSTASADLQDTVHLLDISGYGYATYRGKTKFFGNDGFDSTNKYELARLGDITANSSRLQSSIEAEITSEASARASADAKLQSSVEAEITSEASARASADAKLQSSVEAEITSEASARASADATLQSSVEAEITSEASARMSADAELYSTLEAYMNGSRQALLLWATEVDAGSFLTTSDMRLKDNVEEVSGAVGLVNALHPVFYNWISGESLNPGQKELGFLAQEVEAVLPQVVSTDNTDFKTKRVAYDRIVSVLVAAVKELDARLVVLENN